MKKIIFVTLMAFSIALMPTTTQPITVGDAAYRIAAGVGGILAAEASLALAGASIFYGFCASVSSFAGVAAGQPAALFIAAPLGGISVGCGVLSYGCGYLSYKCFKTALAPEIIQNNTIHIVHHYQDKQE